MLAQRILRRANTFATLLGDVEDVREIGVERQVLDRNVFQRSEAIELSDGGFHFVDGDVGATAAANGILIAYLFSDAIHVQELGHCTPTLVATAPVGARGEPNGKGFGKIFVR